MVKAHKCYGEQKGLKIGSQLQFHHTTHRTRVGLPKRMERRSVHRSKLRNEAL